MYDIKKIQNELEDWIGIRSDDIPVKIPAVVVLPDPSSGSHYDEYHPLLQAETLYSFAPDFNAKGYPDWDNTTNYTQGAKVMHSGYAWRAKRASSGQEPGVTTFWVSLFELWLRERIRSSVNNLFNRLATEKKLDESTKALFDSRPAFIGHGGKTTVSSGRFVGVAIKPKDINNISIDIHAIGMQLTQAQNNISVYMYNSSAEGIVGVVSMISAHSANTFKWTNVDYKMPFLYDPGSIWYIGVYEDDINGNIVVKDYNYLSGPCPTCKSSASERSLYKQWSKYFDIIPVTSFDLNGYNRPNSFEVSSELALNLNVSVRPDLTDIFLSNKRALTYPLGLQFAVDMLAFAVMNPHRRANPVHANIQKEIISYDLDGSGQGKNLGLRGRLDDAIKALSFDFSAISQALPANRPSHFKYRAI